MPFLVIILSALFWALIAVIKKRREYLTKYLVSTIIIVLFLIHPNIVRAMLSLFSCTEIEGDQWLQDA